MDSNNRLKIKLANFISNKLQQLLGEQVSSKNKNNNILVS